MASLQAFCKKALAAAPASTRRPYCTGKAIKKVRAKSPYQSVRVFKVNTEAYLGVQMATGWYVAKLVILRQRGKTRVRGKIRRLAVRNLVAPDGAEIVAETERTTSQGRVRTVLRTQYVVGVGESGVPSGLSLPLKYNYDSRADKTKIRWRFRLRFDKKSGHVSVKRRGRARGVSPKSWSSVLGSHKLWFR